ncbi:MAG TPA: HNH endonuclease signature motif containing protein [Candidatus Baltobacteraceae bacterium]|nr:HNH endonuclease signature motif containing protein [Candidatus Baltobacteraceae bacterium]
MPKHLYDWKLVQKYYDNGHGFVECAKLFGFCHTAWIKAIHRGSLQVEPARSTDRRRKYDWSEIQAYYDEGHSYRQTQRYFGFCAMAWTKAVQRGEITTRSFGMSISQLLANPKRCRSHLKGRLLRAMLLENRCQVCGLSEWLGRPINAHLDHINGIKDDNRLENLRMLCPNCHSQTPTYSGRNARLRRLQELTPVR